MNYKKNIILVLVSLALLSSKVSAESECFERTSRAIFNFNMGLDRMILEPIAKGYNKL
jgi:ABC-type transporter lipoprotein component MlaA